MDDLTAKSQKIVNTHKGIYVDQSTKARYVKEWMLCSHVKEE